MSAYEDFKEFFTIKECPYCKVYDVKEIRKDSALSTVECRHCGLYFFSPRLEKEGLKRYLDNYNRQIDLTASQINVNEINSFERNFLFRVIGDKKLRVLDVGTYNGSFIYALNLMGHDSVGIEPLNKSAEFARSKSLKVISCFFDEDVYEHFNRGTFDLITFRESIYYLPDLKETFKIIKALLNEGGYLYIKCHSVKSPYYWFNKIYRQRYGLHVSGMPTRKSMCKILEREGFQILGVDKWPQNNLFSHIKNMENMLNKRIIGFLLVKFGYFLGYFLNLFGKEDRFLILARYGNA